MYEKRKRARASNDSREESNKSLDHKIVEVQTDSGNEDEVDLLDSRQKNM